MSEPWNIEQLLARVSVSVDDITGHQYLLLRERGWIVSGAVVRDPRISHPSMPTPPSKRLMVTTPTPEASKKVALGRPPKKQKKPFKKAKNRAGGASRRGQIEVPLNPEARERLRQAEVFQAKVTPPQPAAQPSIPTPRAGFVHPQAQPKIDWRDESEDGGMWDR